MHYIRFALSKIPHFDLIIIDKRSAYIAFPTLGTEMHLMFKIEAITKQNTEAIEGLIYWYEKLAKTGFQVPNTKKHFDEWPFKNKKRA